MKIRYIILVAMGLFMAQSCADLEGDVAPLNSIPASDAINSKATAEAGATAWIWTFR